MAPRETENNAYAKFWDDKQRVLWYVTVFSGVNCLWLVCTRRHGSHVGGQGQKHFSPQGTKPFPYKFFEKKL